MLQANTILQNRYAIVRAIGQGGMGTVYLATDQRLGNTVALKESIFTDEKMLTAFEQEARLLAGLRHPALPKVSDHFSEGESKFLVMDYIAGNDLGVILNKRKHRLEPIGDPKPFEVEEVLSWAEQLLDALDYLHTRQSPIIHRDIKPQNLKLAERDQIILLDFGLAKGTAIQMTRATTNKSIFGYTPAYAPIEQIQGSGTDPRSDLYSLAATLYHLMTGIEPPDALHRANSFLGGEIDPLRPANEVNPSISPKVAEVIALAMSQHRTSRPESAKAMLKLLRDAKNLTQLAGQKTLSDAATRVSNPSGSFQPTVPYVASPQAYPGDSVPTQNYQSDPYAPPPLEGNSYPPPPVTLTGRADTNPNPPTMMTTSAPPIHTNHSQAEQKRSTTKKLLSVIGIGMILSGLAVAAAYFYIEGSQNNLSSPPSRNTKTVVPAENMVNKNTANRNAQAATNESIEAITSLTNADNFAPIPAGEFTMGTDDHGDNQDVPHVVKITSPFEMHKYEVTQAQWQAVMGDNPSNNKGEDLPVENVSWDEVQELIEKVNASEDGYQYRLPTEAEWEYAARAGSNGQNQKNLNDVAWTGDNSGLQQLDSMDIWNNDKPNYKNRLLANGSQTHPVGQKKPNKWGLYDMQGNVWEWCEDWYSPDYYLESPEENPQGPETGTQKVNRGGSWYSQNDRCQVTNRSKDAPNTHLFNLGFRLVRTKQ